MNRTGFTLIELLIVVVIIGLLAAIAIPKFGNTKEKAYIASMKTDLRNLMTAEEAYFADSLAYTDQTDCNNPPAPGAVPWCPSTANTIDQFRLGNKQQGGWSARVTNANTAVSCAIYVGGIPNPVQPVQKSDPDGVPLCQ
ncbi:MAG TPA: prepilin-type N-terminal cleavage/methylation domain-containing protein [Gemmatimonadales bacterium]|nr:prepilin-type N-terminal cleavage/methylation domain-containing protein [Gemmatimonadales bacterium]